MSKTKPKDEIDSIKKAREYFWNIAILYAIIKQKVDFVSAGFKIIHEDDKVHEYYNDLYFKKLDMEQFVRNASLSHFRIGQWTPYTNWRKGEPNYITLLDPTRLNVKTAFGKDFIYIKPDPEVQKLLQDDDPKVRAELRKIIPEKYLREWEKGNAVYIPGLKRYVNLKAYDEKEVHSPIEPIYADLHIMEILQDADFRTAQKLKQLFLHIKVGDPEFNNGKSVDKKVIEGVQQLFDDPYKSAELFTQWFVDLQWKIPDLEIFSNKKYESVITRILQWSGMEVMFSSDSSYSEGSIRVKSLKQDIENTRKEIKKYLDKFNEEVALKSPHAFLRQRGSGKPKLPRIKFENNTLDDPNQVAEMLKFLYNTGTLSIEELHDETGYDFKYQIHKKENEKDLEDKIYVHHEPSQGMGGVNKDGGEGNQSEGDKDTNSQPRPGS